MFFFTSPFFGGGALCIRATLCYIHSVCFPNSRNSYCSLENLKIKFNNQLHIILSNLEITLQYINLVIYVLQVEKYRLLKFLLELLQNQYKLSNPRTWNFFKCCFGYSFTYLYLTMSDSVLCSRKTEINSLLKMYSKFQGDIET